MNKVMIAGASFKNNLNISIDIFDEFLSFQAVNTQHSLFSQTISQNNLKVFLPQSSF